MREILFRGKRKDNGEWVYGLLFTTDFEGVEYNIGNNLRANDYSEITGDYEKVIPESIGEYTGLKNKHGKRIFEGDIVKFRSPGYDEFDCISVIKYGEYKQDGSYGEYRARNCLGFYVDLNHIIPYDDYYTIYNDDYTVPDYIKITSLLEVYDKSEIIGNIHENTELLIQ